MLTPDTPVPTEARPALRRFIKSHPKWKGWAMGLVDSREILNKHLLQFAIEMGHGNEVESFLRIHTKRETRA